MKEILRKLWTSYQLPIFMLLAMFAMPWVLAAFAVWLEGRVDFRPSP